VTEAERTIETPEDTPTAEPAGPRRDEPATDAATDAHPREIKRLLGPYATHLWTIGERFGTIGAEVEGYEVEVRPTGATCTRRGAGIRRCVSGRLWWRT
jgi:hypothetical protein